MFHRAWRTVPLLWLRHVYLDVLNGRGGCCSCLTFGDVAWNKIWSKPDVIIFKDEFCVFNKDITNLPKVTWPTLQNKKSDSWSNGWPMKKSVEATFCIFGFTNYWNSDCNILKNNKWIKFSCAHCLTSVTYNNSFSLMSPAHQALCLCDLFYRPVEYKTPSSWNQSTPSQNWIYICFGRITVPKKDEKTM